MTGMLTENLGSQMSKCAALHNIATTTGHRFVFFKELVNTGRILQIKQHFPNFPLEIISINDLDEQDKNYHKFRPRPCAVDSEAFRLDKNFNYDFTEGLHSYRYWYSKRSEICSFYQFDNSVLTQARMVVNKKAADHQTVSVHVRRQDYLTSQIHHNLEIEYYETAFELFKQDEVKFLVFSDDISWCRENFGHRLNMEYVEGTTPIVDMAAMSLCNHNIIANSSFSTWSALLNKNLEKKVVCPTKFLVDDNLIPYLNFAWYPDEFIGLDIM